MASAIDERWATTDISGRPSTNGLPSNCHSTGARKAAANIKVNDVEFLKSRPCESALDTDDQDTLNDVESLKKGIIKTSKNKTSYTILLVGETGVGKSSILELIANVLAGNDTDRYDFDILDGANERGGSNNQSQTHAARLYELMSKNGIAVRILDTPGLADTCGIEQDELHKKSIATQIQSHTDSVTAVLVLASGTIPRVTVSTTYALSTLSSIFPKPLASRTAFMFTNILSPLYWHFSGDTIPDALKDAPHFLLNNPVALQRKYLRLQGDQNMKKGKGALRREVKAGEENAMEVLVDLFDWLDRLEPQSITKIVPLYQEAQNIMSMIADAHAPMDQVVVRKAKDSAVSCPSCPHLAPESHSDWEPDVNQKPARNLNLEKSHQSAEEKEVGHQQLERLRGGWEQKKVKLELLRKVEEKVQEGVRKVKRTLSVSKGNISQTICAHV